MPVPEAGTYLQQVGLNAATGAVTAIVGSLNLIQKPLDDLASRPSWNCYMIMRYLHGAPNKQRLLRSIERG
jgi:hypothetical protein